MKCLKLLGLLAILLPLLVVYPVRADTTADVTITATGVVCGTPSGLTIYYINDREIGISWVKGVGANNTMIRACYGRYPVDIDDGYLVYSGNGTNCSDTGVNLNETVQGIFYRAWSQAPSGVWSILYAEGWFGEHIMLIGNMMFLILFLVLPIGLTVVAFKAKMPWIMFPVMILWVVLALRCNELTTAQWDTFYIVRIMGIMMAAVSMFMIVAIASLKPKEGDILGSNRDDIDIWSEQYQAHRDKIDKRKKLKKGYRED